jgi:uncharacterized membrane protein (UPF0127 family)
MNVSNSKQTQRRNALYVYNNTRETFVATEATLADSYLRRLIGLLGKTRRWARLGAGLWIKPSRGVHTIGMLFPIDLIFLGKENVVVGVEEHLRPFRISKVSFKATSVLELPPHTLYRSKTQIGDRLEIAPLHREAPSAAAPAKFASQANRDGEKRSLTGR